jgi:hypothetical protein
VAATILSVVAYAVLGAGYLVAGSIVARRTGRIGPGILAALVAAVPIVVFVLPAMLADLVALLETVALITASVPLGALGSAIGRRSTTARSGTGVGSQQARPR